jgi:hypothetical protein
MIGLLLGAGLFAGLYPSLKPILMRWPFPAVTVPEFLRLGTWTTILLLEGAMVVLLLALEYLGL